MDVICYSHLRWNFVYQRPQHLLSRFSKRARVFFIEEPVIDGEKAWLQIQELSESLHIITPHLYYGIDSKTAVDEQAILLRKMIKSHSVHQHIAWLYTPMALTIMDALPEPELIVYDCMDELSGFDYAPSDLQLKEQALFQKADIVFTGGYRLFNAKKSLHPNIYPFPSSIDKNHFHKARLQTPPPEDQKDIPGLKLGFFGVIDERLDINLLRELATLKPEWSIILVGPTVKINPDTLPKNPNIYYLGSKSYAELPSYLAGWDVALIPFAINKATEFISPTKTPEYLAGGKPVVSTPIHDVIDPYGKLGMTYIAANAEEFVAGVEWSLTKARQKDWLRSVDYFLKHSSWDDTWAQMFNHVKTQLNKRKIS